MEWVIDRMRTGSTKPSTEQLAL